MCKTDTPQGFFPCSYEKRGTESPDFVGSIPHGGDLGANSGRADRSALVTSQSLWERPVWWILGKSLVKTPGAASMKTSAQAEKRGGPWWDEGLAPRILALQGMGKPASGREPASPRKGGGLIGKTHSCCL